MTLYVAMRDAFVRAAGDEGDWTATRALDGHALECVAASPDRPERVFVGTFESGLFRSTDGGETFERVGDGIASEAVMSASVSPHDPAEVWVGTEPSAVYRSTDGGDTFAEVGDVTEVPSSSEWYFPPRPDTHHVRWVELDPNDRRRVYVGIEAGAFLLSEDRGTTWRERPPGSRRDNHQLATHADAPGWVYAAAGDGYAESTDGGETWERPQAGLEHRYVWSVAADPDEPDRVLVSAATGASRAHRTPGAESYVYRRTGVPDGGDRWTRLDDRGLPTGEGVLRAVLAPGSGAGEFYAASNHGIYRTADGGDAWERLDVAWPDRFAEQTVRGLAVV